MESFYNIPRSLKAVCLAAAIVFAALQAFPALAQGAGTIRSGLQNAATQSGLDQGGGINLESVVGNLINALLSVVGVLLLVYLIYGGFKYMTAGGEQKNVAEAISIIKNAVIGLIIIVLSYYIADFVLSRLIGATGGGVVTPG